MNPKEKIRLTLEQETLLIPLYSKAQINPIFVDEKAREILDCIEYDFSRLKIPQKTEVTLRIRARQLDVFTADFIEKYPNALILHLGCGLDSRCLRVPRAHSAWIDLDMPDVIALRRKFFPENAAYRMIPSSVTDLTWLDQVDATGRPVFIVAEGLLMYLYESDVKALICALHERFPGSEMVFDAFNQMTVDRIQSHPSLAKTGASVRWGIDNPCLIESWGEGIKLNQEWYFSQSPEIAHLDWFYRMMFHLTASIPVVQKAQRILYLVL